MKQKFSPASDGVEAVSADQLMLCRLARLLQLFDLGETAGRNRPARR